MEIMHKGMWTGRRVLYLSVDAIRANPDQPRKYFEPEALRELAESIRRYGILQPLTVRHGEDGYELIAGERRLRAAKLAGLREVPCLAVQSDEEESALLSLIENLQRQDLHYMEEAADADHVVILDEGRILAEGTPLELKNRYTGDTITLYHAEESAVAALGLPYEKVGAALRIAVPDTRTATQLILQQPELFTDYEIIKGRMDDVFLAVTGKNMGGAGNVESHVSA